MNLAKIMLANLWARFLKKLKDEIDFFRKKPLKLLAVNRLAEVTLDNIIKQIKKLILSNGPLFLALASNQLLKKNLEKNNVKIANEDYLSDKSVEIYINNSPEVKNIIALADNNFNDESAGDIVNLCSNPNLTADNLTDLMQKLNLSEFNEVKLIDNLIQNSDLDNRADQLANRSDVKSLAETIAGILPYVMLTLYIIIRIKEFLNQNEHPSKFRGKYLSKLISTTVALMKSTLNGQVLGPAKQLKNNAISQVDSINKNIKSAPDVAKKEINNIIPEGKEFTQSIINPLIKTLKSVDAIIGAVLLAASIYFFNRKMLQQKALDEFSDDLSLSTAIACPKIDLPKPFFENPNLKRNVNAQTPLNVNEAFSNFSCPVNLDVDFIPSIPFSDKNFVACPVESSVPEPALDEPELNVEITNKAIFSFSGITPKIVINIGQIISNGDNVYYADNKYYSSPINGKVTKVDNKNQEIYLEILEESETSSEEKLLNELTQLYTEKTNIEDLLNLFYAESALPSYLDASPVKDSSIISKDSVSPIYVNGINPHWTNCKKDIKKLTEDYYRTVQKEMASDRIEELISKDGDLMDMATNLDKIKLSHFNSIKTAWTKYFNRSKKTAAKKAEFVLSEYYVQLWNTILDAERNENTLEWRIKTPVNERESNVELSKFRDIIGGFLFNRFKIDKYNVLKLKTKINELATSLEPKISSKLISFFNKPKETDYYNQINDIFLNYTVKKNNTVLAAAFYNQSLASLYPNIKFDTGNSNVDPAGINTTNISQQAIIAISNYFLTLAKKNIGLTDAEKNSIIFKIVTLYLISKVSPNVKVKEDLTVYKLLTTEASQINALFNSAWIRFFKLPGEIDNKLKQIESLSNGLTKSGTIEKDGEDYILYTGSPERVCPIPEDGDYLSPLSKYGFDNIKYWMRYCKYATLSSVISGTWGTGILPPIGPIPFPTVYIPIKAWQKEWGIILIGLTLTGAYPFPFLMVANLSASPQVAFGNPAKPLKDELKKEKKALLDQISGLKKSVIKPKLDESLQQINFLKAEKADTENQLAEVKSNRPIRERKYTDVIGKALELAQYTSKMLNWTKLIVSLNEQKLVLSRKIYTETLNYKLLNGLYKGVTKLKSTLFPNFKPIELIEKRIEKTFRVLEKMADKIDLFIAKLPIATLMGSANFGPTIKNPKPITQIDKGIVEDLVNQNYLDNLFKSFEPQKETLMSTKFGGFLTKTFVSNKKVKEALNLVRLVLIPKEAFPKYENLKIGNVAWTLRFLLVKWAPTGGKQFGFPGFPQYPIK